MILRFIRIEADGQEGLEKRVYRFLLFTLEKDTSFSRSKEELKNLLKPFLFRPEVRYAVNNYSTGSINSRTLSPTTRKLKKFCLILRRDMPGWTGKNFSKELYRWNLTVFSMIIVMAKILYLRLPKEKAATRDRAEGIRANNIRVIIPVFLSILVSPMASTPNNYLNFGH